jgi:hypothetical protein
MLDQILAPLEKGDFLDVLCTLAPMMQGLLARDEPLRGEQLAAMREWKADRARRRDAFGPQ